MKVGHSAQDSGIVESGILESWNPGILEFLESIPCHGFYWAASRRILAAIWAGTATRFEIFPFSFSF